MDDREIIGVMIRQDPLAYDLLEWEKRGIIENYEGKEVVYQDDKDRAIPFFYKWYVPISKSQRFAYEWREQFIQGDYVYFAIITHKEICSAEEYRETREKLSGERYICGQ